MRTKLATNACADYISVASQLVVLCQNIRKTFSNLSGQRQGRRSTAVRPEGAHHPPDPHMDMKYVPNTIVRIFVLLFT